MATRIPLIPGAAKQAVDVALEGARYRIRVRWQPRYERYTASLWTTDDTLIAGDAPVWVDWPLWRHADPARRPPGVVVLLDTAGTGRQTPTREDLATTMHLAYIPQAELPAAAESAAQVTIVSTVVA